MHDDDSYHASVDAACIREAIDITIIVIDMAVIVISENSYPANYNSQGKNFPI